MTAVDRVPDYAKFCPRCATPFGHQVEEGYLRPVCPSCGFVLYLDPKVAVACIIPLNGGIVLGKRATNPGLGKWSFPSGYANSGEVLESAAAREVLEETSLEVRMGRLLGVYSEVNNPVILVVYEATVLEGKPCPGDELSEVGVFPPTQLPTMAFAHDEQIVQDWLRGR